MYREWTRDFRRCELDCRGAISHLSEGTLCQWYREKLEHLTDLVKGMLSGRQGLNEEHQIRDTRTGMTIPSALVTIARRNKSTDAYHVHFATMRISEVVVDIQETRRWANDWDTLVLFFRNPETRVAAGKRFQSMFLQKFRSQDPNAMPQCYRLISKDGPHPESDSSHAATMP